jgi:hypothetical protein
VVENLGILMVPFFTRFFLGFFWVVLMLTGLKVFRRRRRISQSTFSFTSSPNEDESNSITKSKSSEAGEEESSHLD